MGYAVYEQTVRGVTRWAGYGVPAECDWPDCLSQVDRGLGYRCDDPFCREDGDDAGCGLTFCGEHLYDTAPHHDITPKGESAEWMRHVLTDETWEQWRTENPDRADTYRRALDGGGAETGGEE